MSICSGKFVVRIASSLHERLTRFAAAQNLSLNQVCIRFLQEGLAQTRRGSPEQKMFQREINILKRHFRYSLLGVVLFGSRVQGTATLKSDWDMLVVLEAGILLKRSLYSWWDKTITVEATVGTVNPHFVHMPDGVENAGGLWLEVALHHKILFEHGKRLSVFLNDLLDLIRRGERVRNFSNGHPYWVRREHA